MIDETEDEAPASVTVLARLDPATEIEPILAGLSGGHSLRKFVKAAETHGLHLHVQGALSRQGATLYLSKGGNRAIGEVKKEAFEYRVITLTLTDFEGFAVQATWFERFPTFRDGTPKPPEFEFDHAFVGGKRSGHRPELFVQKKSTVALKEIDRCMSA